MNSEYLPEQPTAQPSSAECWATGFERQTVEASEHLRHEWVSIQPDGTVTATRDTAERSMRCVQERALSVAVIQDRQHPQLRTLPAPPRQCIASAPRVDIRSALRWSLSAYLLTLAGLQPLAGWAAPGIFAQLFLEPPGLLHALAGTSATFCAHWRCYQFGTPSFVGRLLPRVWLAFLVLPMLPQPLKSPDVFVALLRCALLPSAVFWAFLPVATNAQAWLRRLACQPRQAPQKWLNAAPSFVVTATLVRHEAPLLWPVHLFRSWFSGSPSPTACSIRHETPILSRPIHQPVTVLKPVPPRPLQQLPNAREGSGIHVPKRSRLRVRR